MRKVNIDENRQSIRNGIFVSRSTQAVAMSNAVRIEGLTAVHQVGSANRLLNTSRMNLKSQVTPNQSICQLSECFTRGS